MKDRQKVIVWRGSHTHVRDLMYYAADILTLHDQHPDWKWFFLGYEPFFITEKMRPESYGTAPFAGHMEYFNLLQKLQAPIHIVPLPKNQFNESKSNIAWIEGTLAGSAVLCPDFKEWNVSGAQPYQENSFIKNLGMLMAAKDDYPEYLEGLQEQSWQTVLNHLTLTKVNAIRRICLQKLVEGSIQHKASFGIAPLNVT